MRYPDFLHREGRIGFIAPSFGCNSDPYLTRFKKALRRFRKWGYETVLGPNCLIYKGVGKSNTPEECGHEVNQFFLTDNCDVIISCGGGETMCEDLPYIDFDEIAKSKPKWYMGFSDNTNLTFTLPTLCDTAAIYGPCVSSFGTKPIDQYVTDAFDILCGKKTLVRNYKKWEKGNDSEDPYAAGNYTEPFELVISNKGKDRAEFSGRLIGGCLDCLVNLSGTPYDKAVEFAERYKEDGIIWFLEACDLNPMGIRRALWVLQQKGWFQHVKGFVIGRSVHYDEDFLGFTCIDAYLSMLEKYNVPIILDADLGHMDPSMPLISGALADVRAVKGHNGDRDSLKIQMYLR